MIVISDHSGFVLSFQSKDDLKQHVENLVGLLEWVEAGGTSAPHLYGVDADRTLTVKEREARLSHLKAGLVGFGVGSHVNEPDIKGPE